MILIIMTLYINHHDTINKISLIFIYIVQFIMMMINNNDNDNDDDER